MVTKNKSVRERLGILEERTWSIKSSVERIDKKLDRAIPSKILVVLINVILLGCFVWLGVLTYSIIGG